MSENQDDEGKLISMYAWVVALSPFGQMLFSPFLGWLNTKMKSSRPALIASGVLMILSNGLYSILSAFPESSRFALLLVSRFLSGCLAGNICLLIFFENVNYS